MADEFLDGFIDDYFAECEEHLATIRRLLLALEAGVGRQAAPPAVLDELFRSFHSLKGISGMVELREAEMLAHDMESYLRALRQREAQLTAAGMDALIRGVDALEQAIAARRERAAAAVDRPDGPPARRGRAAGGRGRGTADRRAAAPWPTASWRVTFVPSPALVARGVNVDSVRARLRDAGEIVDATPRVTPEGDRVRVPARRRAGRGEPGRVGGRRHARRAGAPWSIRASAGEPAPDSGARVASSHVVRVDLARLDELMRMVGDLVISRARLDRHAGARRRRTCRPATGARSRRTRQTIERQLRELREGVMRVRLVPVGEIFRRMPFVVRDLARESGQAGCSSSCAGQEHRDRQVPDRADDGSGAAPGAQRRQPRHRDRRTSALAAGKPPEGTITLARRQRRRIVVHRDRRRRAGHRRGGGGRARARRLGLPVPDGPIDAATLLDLICAPGFSTRDEADRASGRGVGMAVVQDDRRGAVRDADAARPRPATARGS